MKEKNIEIMNKWKKIIEKELNKYVIIKGNYEKTVYQAMSYSLNSGGKRIRPILMIAVSNLFRNDFQYILPYACAIEMIHTYSLIHDDLPAMDDDDFRRGKETSHKVFGEAIAILTGDALLNKAYEIMLQDILMNKGDVNYIKAASLISKAAGEKGMIAGQVVDIESQGEKVSKLKLDYMHKCKTGCLLKASVLVPAYINEVSDKELKAIEKYGECIGIAFQIKDDILDYCGDESILGKPIGSDKEKNKSTYVSIFGIERAKEILEKTIDEAITSISIFDEKADILKELANYIMNRKK